MQFHSAVKLSVSSLVCKIFIIDTSKSTLILCFHCFVLILLRKIMSDYDKVRVGKLVLKGESSK